MVPRALPGEAEASQRVEQHAVAPDAKVGLIRRRGWRWKIGGNRWVFQVVIFQ